MSDNSDNSDNSYNNNNDENSDRIVRRSPSGGEIRRPPTLRESERRNKRLQLEIQQLHLEQPQYQQKYSEHKNSTVEMYPANPP